MNDTPDNKRDSFWLVFSTFFITLLAGIGLCYAMSTPEEWERGMVIMANILQRWWVYISDHWRAFWA